MVVIPYLVQLSCIGVKLLVLNVIFFSTNTKKQCRPASNLSFLWEITEKIVANHIFQHMTENGVHDKMQSAYKTYHTTETALSFLCKK